MSNPRPQIRLCLVLHNHQPIGNFENVFEAAYQDSYLPFLGVFEKFIELSISLHISGPLLQWLEANHPEYVSRVADLAEQGRIEVIGGASYEPILSMIPVRDRVGQIKQFSDRLTDRICSSVQGMWIPERVWESSLASSIADANIQYTVLDDYHFRRAGLLDQQLTGYFVTEDQGRTLKVFPSSEHLRYLIPFGEPQETIDYCRGLAQQCPGGVVVFGDDGEKFGTWPNTHQHVYANGWLNRFFEALVANKDWLLTTTLSDAVQQTPPRGKVYLPAASYREMTEWALPADRQVEYEHLAHKMKHDPRWNQIQSFAAGGFWRNFKVKYPETNQMYSRMMFVSDLLQQAEKSGGDVLALDKARDHLYRGQCNCAYWHGAFGGVYLPHLRAAIYQNLLTAESIINQASRPTKTWVEATTADYNFDGCPDIRLANEQLSAWIAPHAGGQIYELDVHLVGHNLGATIQRRPEAYHQQIRQGQSEDHDQASSPQADLKQNLFYDARQPNILTDHFWDNEVEVAAIQQGTAMERGDFADGQYDATVRRKPGRIQVMLAKTGNAWGVPLKITKGVTLNAGSDVLEIAYLIDGLPADQNFHFGVDFNFAALPAGENDRYYVDGHGQRLGELGTALNLNLSNRIGVIDQWLNLAIDLQFDQLGGVYAYPIQTVSQSEAGFELVHQSVCVQPHWVIRGDASGRWICRMQLRMNSSSTTMPTANDRPAVAAGTAS